MLMIITIIVITLIVQRPQEIRALAYVDRRDPSNISSQPLDGGPPRQLTDFKPDRVFSFAWSRDGKQLALARGTLTNDVILISDFR